MRAVFFDVDFTLIHPGPTFQADGYVRACARFGIRVNPAAFETAVRQAAPVLEVEDLVHDPTLFLHYTRCIIVGMGGRGDGLDACAREIYEAWARCEHFSLYADVRGTLEGLVDRGLGVGLISNTHRCLEAFQRHFALEGVFAVTVSSAEHGYMKPHPSIFRRALDGIGVAPGEAMMVGDSLRHDVEGARGVGMRAVLVSRQGEAERRTDDVPVIRELTELVQHL